MHMKKGTRVIHDELGRGTIVHIESDDHSDQSKAWVTVSWDTNNYKGYPVTRGGDNYLNCYKVRGRSLTLETPLETLKVRLCNKITYLKEKQLAMSGLQ